MNGSMMQQPLLISSLLTHAERHHGEQEVVSRRVEGDVHRYTFRELAARSRRLANEFEHCYGDTSALNVPGRWYALTKCLADPVARTKLVHGSDWPILPIPPAPTIGWSRSRDIMREPNWIRRDVLIKQQFPELDQDYWTRAARVLKLNRPEMPNA